MPTGCCGPESRSLDERDRALARRLAFGTVQRARTLDHAIETLGKRPVRKLDGPVRDALRLGAYQLAFMDGVPRYAAVNESVELVRQARLERAVPFANAVLRRLADGARDLCESLPEATPAEAALRHSYPDWVAETWWRELGPDAARALMARAERGAGDRRAARSRCDRGARGHADPRRLGRRPRRRGGARRGAHLAAEPRLAARRSRRRVGARGADARPLRGARRQGDDARRRGRGGRGRPVARGAARGERAPPRRDRRASWSSRTAATCRPSSTASTARSSTPPARGSASSRRAPTSAGAPCRCRGSSSSSSAPRSSRTRPGGTVVYSTCTINAEECEDVVDAVVSEGIVEVDRGLGDEWPAFRHGSRPEFLQTLPHVHGTSGFFVARLRVPSP